MNPVFRASLPKLCLLLMSGLFSYGAVAQIAPDETIRLWQGSAAGAMGNAPADIPVIEVYLPKNNPTHAGVLICPGGSYRGLALGHEGSNVAEWLVHHDVAAFVLHYRTAPYKYPVPLADSERAMRVLRSRAASYRFASDHLGVWGFSVGGHVASHLMVAFDAGKPQSSRTDDIDALPDRPDFAILSYPVISMRPGITHRGSHDNLLGSDAGTALEQEQSNELHVRPDSPPLFLVAANDDPIVSVRNSVLLYQAYLSQKLAVDMHLFSVGGHGFALGKEKPSVAAWPPLLAIWMMQHGWMAPERK